MTAEAATMQAQLAATLDKAARELETLKSLLPMAQQSAKETRSGTTARAQANLDVEILTESIRTLESITKTSPGLEAAISKLHNHSQDLRA